MSKINCSIANCAYNNTQQNACNLDEISIGSSQAKPSTQQATDCQSFKTSDYN